MTSNDNRRIVYHVGLLYSLSLLRLVLYNTVGRADPKSVALPVDIHNARNVFQTCFIKSRKSQNLIKLCKESFVMGETLVNELPNSFREEHVSPKIFIKLQLKFVKGPWTRKTAFNINHVPRIQTK